MGAEGLRKRANMQIDLLGDALLLGDTAAVFAVDERRVRLVQAEQRAVLISQRREALTIGQIAVHREERVRDNELPWRARALQERLEVVEVIVPVDVERRARTARSKPRAIDD